MSFVPSTLTLILAAMHNSAVSAVHARAQQRPLLQSETPLITLRTEMYPNIDFQLFPGNSAKWHGIRAANERMARGRYDQGNVLKLIGENHDSWDAATVRNKLERALELYPQDSYTRATLQSITESTDEQMRNLAHKCWTKMSISRRSHAYEYPFQEVGYPVEHPEDITDRGDYVAVAINTELQMPEMYVSVWRDERASGLEFRSEENKIQKHFFISRDWRFQIRRWLMDGRGTANLAMGLHCAARQATHAQRIASSPMDEMSKIMHENGFVHTADTSEEEKEEIHASGHGDQQLISTAETRCPRFEEIFP